MEAPPERISSREFGDSLKARFAKGADRSEADRMLASAIRRRAQELRESPCRPTRISATSLLKYFGQLSKFSIRKAKYPITAKALEEVSESRSEFLERKILWGLNKLKIEKIPLSMNVFRRLVTTPAPALSSLRQQVTEIATRLGIEIDERSMFASNHSDKRP